VTPLTGSKAKLRNKAVGSLSRVEISPPRLAVFFGIAIFCFFLTEDVLLEGCFDLFDFLIKPVFVQVVGLSEDLASF